MPCDPLGCCHSPEPRHQEGPISAHHLSIQLSVRDEASIIRDSLENASLNFQNCEGETPNHECVGATLNAIALCFKNIVIDSDCVQKTFDVSKDIRIDT